MFFVARFILCWVVWIIFANKKRWRELFSVSLFAALLGTLWDHLMHHYPLDSFETYQTFFQGTLFPVELMDDFGMYLVSTYLYIQWLPKRKIGWLMILYILGWSLFCTGIEWIHLRYGYMVHKQWWSLPLSFWTDSFLFALFFVYYRLFRLDRLS